MVNVIINYILLIIYAICIGAKRKKAKKELRKEKRLNFNNEIDKKDTNNTDLNELEKEI